MSDYPTSKALEKIVEGFELTILEAIPGHMGKDGDIVLRLAFEADDDNGRRFQAGCTATYFSKGLQPRDVSATLRDMAQQLDEYWARAFPGAME